MSKTLPSWNLQGLLRHPAKDFKRITKKLNALISALEAERPHLSAGYLRRPVQENLGAIRNRH